MTTITIDIDNEKDIPVLKEILTRFGLNYRVDKNSSSNKKEDKLYKNLKQSFSEIKEWEAGKIKLQNASDAIKEIEAELNNGL